MNYLTLEHITKYYGEKCLFEDISFFVDKGNKVAFVAKNGSGKSTLLRLITGQEKPDGDTYNLHCNKNIKIGFLEQEPEFDPEITVLDAVFEGDSPILGTIKRYEMALVLNQEEQIQKSLIEMEDKKAWDYEVKIKQILSKFKITDFAQKTGYLSGGQKKRLALAKIIIEEPDFLILDEPTNHLDIDMIEWLETFLSRDKLTVFMVTHDRYFLDRVCNQILELDQGSLYKYKGNYSTYLENKATRHSIEMRTLERDKKLFNRELEWMRKSPQARSTKAKSRIDSFYDLKEKTNKRITDDKVSLDIVGNRLGKKIIELHKVSKAYGDLKLLDSFEYKFRKRERLGIVGVNGAGKSTFLKLLTGEVQADSGRVVVGETVKIGHYTQDGLPISDDKRVIEVVRDVAEVIPLSNGKEVTAKQMLERFLFPAPQHRVYVSKLSGGEKRRLYLLTILMQNPNFLILDEPTNDLDILTLNVLEEFLLEFSGCMVVVTHDRYFMDKLVEHLFVFEGEGKIKDFNGNYSVYRDQKKQSEQAETKEKTVKKVVSAPEKEEAPKKRKLTYMEKKEFEKLEKEIEKIEARKITISEAFNQADITPEQIKSYSMELGELEKQLATKEERWMELAEFA